MADLSRYSFKELPSGKVDILENGVSTAQGGPGYDPSYAVTLGYKPTTPPVQQTTTQPRLQAAQHATTLTQMLGRITSAQQTPQLPGAAAIQSKNGIQQGNSTPDATVINDMDNGDGTRTVTYANGTTDRVRANTNTDGSQQYQSMTPEEGIKYDMNSSIAEARARHDKEVSYATTTLDGIKKMSDVATSALIDSIKQIYQARIGVMEDSNRRLVQVETQSGFRSGRARYTPKANQGLLSNTEQEGIMRVSQLEGEMLSLIAKAQSAQTDNDINLFNQHMDALTKADAELQDSVQNLHRNAIDEMNYLQQKRKDDLNAQHQQTQDSLDISSRVAPALIDELSKLTSNDDKMQLVEEVAKNLGIDPAVLLGDVQAATSKDAKAQLELENIKNQMANRNAATRTAQANTSIAAQRLAMDKQKQIFDPTAADKSTVMQWVTNPKNGYTSNDIKKVQEDPTFFYHVLGEAKESEL